MDEQLLPGELDVVGAVARALHQALSEDGAPAWDDLPEDDRAGLLESASVAIDIHNAVLSAAGFKLIPPGTISAPQSDAEANAMIAAGTTYFQAKSRKKLLVGAPAKIIMPPGRA